MTDSIANGGGCCSGSVRPGTYGNAYDVAQITVDKCGRITKISNVAISGGGGGSSQWTGTKGDPIYYVPYVGIGSSSIPTANLQVTGNVYVSNAVTTPNVHVTDTLDVLGSMTANAANATFFFDTFTIPYINTQYLNVASNTVLTGNLSAPLANITTLNVQYLYANSAIIYGTSTLNVYGISNLSTTTINGGLSVTGNVYVSNAVSTTNVFASNDVVIGPAPTAILANLHVERGDIFIGNSAATGTISDSGATTVSRLIFDNTNRNTVVPNKIVLYSNSASGNVCGISMSTTAQTDVPSLVYQGGNHSFVTKSTTSLSGYQAMIISADGQLNLSGSSSRAHLDISSGNLPASNVQVRIDSSNIALVTSGSGLVGFGTLTPSANLHVIGNVYASNALTTTNVFATNANVGTLNVASTSNLQSVTYSLDILAQGPYLNPSTANASVITQWYSRLVNTTSRPFWSVSATPQSSYINTSNLGGYYSQTLLNDGRVLFNQINGTNIGFFYPDTNQFSYITGVSISNFDYSGVIQIPDGRVIFIPCNGNKVGLLNPFNYSFSSISTGTSLNGMHYGAVYEPTGNVIMTPTNSSNVGIFNTNTGTYSRVAFSSEISLNTTIYFGSVLLPDGRVVFIPNGTSNVGIYTPSTATYSNVTVTVNGKYAGGCLMPDGNVFMVPNTASSNACIYNPNLNTVSNVTTSGPGIGGNGAAGAVALPDGRILVIPTLNNSAGVNFAIYNYKLGTYTILSSSINMYQNSALLGGGTLLPDGRVIITTQYGAGLLNFRTPAPREFCLHPFFNKF